MKIIDLDISYAYSPIRVEKINNNDEILRIYPIPAMSNSDVIVEWYPVDGREKVRLHLVDIHGKLAGDYILNNGINKLYLNNINPGIYYISIEDYNFNRILRKMVILDY
ncbi:MAG: T9SS type A sorting domain-containing protein [Saprospiraceae bacterium]|nr:T9SS type A sorting domain-containing protein [Saprospiraceae bacterium]